MPEEVKAEARRRALPAIAAYRDAGCVLPPPPPPAVLHEMMEFLACEPIADDVAEMFLEDLHMDGSDAREITWGGEIPDRREGRRPRGRDRMRRGRPARRHPSRPGGDPVHDRREEPGSRRHVVGEPVPRRPGRHRQPLLLLLVRARRPLDRVLLAATRAAGLRRPRHAQVRRRHALPLRHRGDGRDVRRGHRSVVGRRAHTRRSARAARRVRGDQCGRVAEPAAPPRDPRHGRLRGARRSTRPAGTAASTSAARAFALVGAGASGFQIAPTIADDGRAAHGVPTHGAVGVPEPELPRAGARR